MTLFQVGTGIASTFSGRMETFVARSFVLTGEVRRVRVTTSKGYIDEVKEVFLEIIR